MNSDPDVKKTAQCLGSDDDTETPCVDKNGIPIIENVVLGGTTCEDDKNVPCNACNWNSKALMIACVSPSSFYFDETLSTMNYA